MLKWIESNSELRRIYAEDRDTNNFDYIKICNVILYYMLE